MKISEEELKDILKVAFRYRFAYVGSRLRAKDRKTFDDEKETEMWINDIKTLYKIVDKYDFDMGDFK